MKRALLCLFFLSVASGCAVDAIADCEAGCQNRIDNGCSPAGTTDCMANCVDAQQAYDQAQANAAAAQCQGEADSLYGCLNSGNQCEMDRCQSEFTASSECFNDFCRSRPTSPVCSGP